MKRKEKYSGLRWYLPSYFKDNLAKCRFEEGIIIYKDEQPLDKNWGEKIPHIDFLIQIQFPARTTTMGSGDESEIELNWNTEVILDLFYPNTKETKTIKTTQGRLFTFLWKDNFEILHGTEPLLPLLFISNKTINEHSISDKVSIGSVG